MDLTVKQRFLLLNASNFTFTSTGILVASLFNYSTLITVHLTAYEAIYSTFCCNSTQFLVKCTAAGALVLSYVIL